MPKGPQGQKRPADVIGNAVHIAKIATVEIEDTTFARPAKVRSGQAEALSAEERSDIARKAAAGRWG